MRLSGKGKGAATFRKRALGRTIVTLTVLAVALIAINAQALAQLVEVPPEVIRALNVLFDLINKRTPIWINPQQKITRSAAMEKQFCSRWKPPSLGTDGPKKCAIALARKQLRDCARTRICVYCSVTHFKCATSSPTHRAATSLAFLCLKTSAES